MRFKYKYIYPIAIFLLVYLFGTLIFSLGTVVANYGYSYMNYLFPRVFPTFSPISEKAEYEKYLCLVSTVGMLISYVIINFFSIRFDNKKFELVVSKTDGQYTVLEGMRLYLSEFLISDVISFVILPLVLVIPSYAIPKIEQTTVPVVNLLIAILDYLLWMSNAFKEYYSLTVALPIALVFAVIARLTVIPGALKHWRGAWLSGSIH